MLGFAKKLETDLRIVDGLDGLRRHDGPRVLGMGQCKELSGPETNGLKDESNREIRVTLLPILFLVEACGGRNLRFVDKQSNPSAVKFCSGSSDVRDLRCVCIPLEWITMR